MLKHCVTIGYKTATSRRWHRTTRRKWMGGSTLFHPPVCTGHLILIRLSPLQQNAMNASPKYSIYKHTGWRSDWFIPVYRKQLSVFLEDWILHWHFWLSLTRSTGWAFPTKTSTVSPCRDSERRIGPIKMVSH